MRIAHVIRPGLVSKNSSLKLIQDVTFNSLQVAKEATVVGNAFVEQYIAVYSDEEIPYLDFNNCRLILDRSSLSLAGSPFTLRYALLDEILDKVFEKSNADFIIYSDLDIALKPDFYKGVIELIEKGIDAFAISNHVLNQKYNRLEQFPTMIEAESIKQNEAGCIVYSRNYHKRLLLGNSFAGHNWTNVLLICNLMAVCDSFRLFDDSKLTFSLDMDSQIVMDNDTRNYSRFNEMELLSILSYLLSNYEVYNRSKLFSIYKEQLNSFYFKKDISSVQEPQYQIDENIAKENSPKHPLQLPTDIIYHNNYRADGDWSAYKHQILRQDPVFIVGYPRSGTTLVQSLLATQKNTITLHETHFFCVIEKLIKTRNGKIISENLDELIHNIRERVSFSVNAEEHIKKLLSTTGLSKKMLFEIVIIDNLICQKEHGEISDKIWIEKTPDHALFIEEIAALYPKAKFIYIVRHPEKAIISRKEHFKWNNENTWPIEKHINRWLDSIKAAEFYRHENPDSIMFVRMEDVIENPDIQISNICKFLDIPFDRGSLANYQDISRLTTYSWEKWKKDASGEISVDKVKRKSDHLPIIDRLVINKELSKYLTKYNYSIEFDDRQAKELGSSEFANSILNNYMERKQLHDLAKIRGQIIDLNTKRAQEKEKFISELKVNMDKYSRVIQKREGDIKHLQLNNEKLEDNIVSKKINIQELQQTMKEIVLEKETLTEILENNNKKLEETSAALNENNKRINELLELNESNKKIIQELKISIETIMASSSYKIGRIITKPFRLIK